MTSPLDRLKKLWEEKATHSGFGNVHPSDCEVCHLFKAWKETLKLAEAYREVAKFKSFLGVASPISDDEVKRCTPIFYDRVDLEAAEILNSKEG